MSNPKTSGNGRRRVVASSTRVWLSLRKPTKAVFHAASCRHPITNQQSKIKNPCVWFFRIGGYQVCEKWLKDRKGRTLDYADLQHDQKVVVALRETIRLMGGIDQMLEAHGGWPEAFDGGEVRPFASAASIADPHRSQFRGKTT